ncbi:hypothetical protein BV25DRAFT_1781585, partial [Artomyces pyxidatus]
HWAMPRPMWKEQEAEKAGKGKMTKLDKVFTKVNGSREFSRKSVLHTVAVLIACDDQPLALANKPAFRNCLVDMRPKSTTADLPSTHDICVHIHNEFVKTLEGFSRDIKVMHTL